MLLMTFKLFLQHFDIQYNSQQVQTEIYFTYLTQLFER